MASYFDPQPHQSKNAATAEVVGVRKDDEAFGRMGLLSPQVTQILDELDLEGHSSSGDDDSLSGNSKGSDEESPKEHHRHKSSQKGTQVEQSSHKDQKQSRLAPPRPGLGVGSGRQKQPHFARFHSLRSMLFSSRIEADIQRSQEAEEQEQAEAKWKAEYESRKGLNRPRTPERPSSSGSSSPTKEGFRHRIGNRIRRMTSKEVPTMGQVPEDSVPEINDNESTASSENDGEGDEREDSRRHRDFDEESINHSDVEDLVRWVSRRDPPSDGEARTKKLKDQDTQDTDHESIGNSDVEDLVRWVSRKPGADKREGFPQAGNNVRRESETEKREEVERMGYSDVSTESDSEGGVGSSSSPGGEDAEELSRWISHREGPRAGPVRKNQDAPPPQKVASNHSSDLEPQESDHPELSRWIDRRDDTSGESEVPASGYATPSRREEPSQVAAARPENRSSLTHDDINDLVRWVSRKDSKNEPPKDSTLSDLRNTEDERKKKVGMHADTGSLSHGDISELVDFVKKKDTNQQQEQVLDGKEKYGENKQQDLPLTIHQEPRDKEVQVIGAKEQEKKEQLGMKEDMGSLSHGDVNELVEWVSRKQS